MNLYTYDAQSRPTSAVVQPSAFSLQFAASTCNTTGNLTRISGRTRTCTCDTRQLLGHAKLDTTAIYTEVSIKQLQEVHRRCHPILQEDLPLRKQSRKLPS